MRAREPDEQGYVERDGVRIGYETFNDAAADQGRPTVLFVPIDTCVHSRAWKAPGAVPRPALPRRHHRPAGQRPVRPAAPTRRRTTTSTFVADTRRGDGPPRRRAGRAGGHLRERLAGAARRVAASPSGSRAWSRSGRGSATARRRCRSGRRPPRTSTTSCDVLRAAGSMGNRHYLPDALAGVRGVLLRPDAVRAALDQAARGHPRASTGATTGQVQLAEAGTAPGTPSTWREEAEALLRGDRPAGAGDPGHRGPLPAARPGRERSPSGPAASMLVLEGSGHLPMARHPVAVNRAIKGFVDRVTGAPAPARPPRWRHDASRRGRSTSPLRSGSATCAATWPSPTRCASGGPTWRSSG